jgi:hypothetical protein
MATYSAEVRVVQLLVHAPVPVGTDRPALAQQLADRLQTVTRVGTGETYPAAADVFVTTGLPELKYDGHEVPLLLVQTWVERPWQQENEWRNVIADFTEVVEVWLREEYSVPGGGRLPMAFVLPLAHEQQSKALVGVSDFVARASGDLPAHWRECMARHRATAGDLGYLRGKVFTDQR